MEKDLTTLPFNGKTKGNDSAFPFYFDVFGGNHDSMFVVYVHRF